MLPFNTGVRPSSLDLAAYLLTFTGNYTWGPIILSSAEAAEITQEVLTAS